MQTPSRGRRLHIVHLHEVAWPGLSLVLSFVVVQVRAGPPGTWWGRLVAGDKTSDKLGPLPVAAPAAWWTEGQSERPAARPFGSSLRERAHSAGRTGRRGAVRPGDEETTRPGARVVSSVERRPAPLKSLPRGYAGRTGRELPSPLPEWPSLGRATGAPRGASALLTEGGFPPGRWEAPQWPARGLHGLILGRPTRACAWGPSPPQRVNSATSQVRRGCGVQPLLMLQPAGAPRCVASLEGSSGGGARWGGDRGGVGEVGSSPHPPPRRASPVLTCTDRLLGRLGRLGRRSLRSP